MAAHEHRADRVHPARDEPGGEGVDSPDPGVRRRVWRWRVGTLVVGAGAGALVITTGLNAHGLDLRASSITDLVTVVRQQKAHTDDLQSQVATLNRQVSSLTAQVDDKAVAHLQRQVDALKGPAGLEPVSGPGLTVTLDDAPKKDIDAAVANGEATADELIVHQQDIQAVVNALWQGGATAMTLEGERVVATTGIKCVGNSVILHGVPHSPPYKIAAVGNPAALQEALDASTYVSAYRALIPLHLGYEVTVADVLDLPAYDGSVALHYATPATPTRSTH